MDASQIISEINNVATLLVPNTIDMRPVQLGKLAGAIESVLKSQCCIVSSADRAKMRKGIQGLVAGVELRSSKDLDGGMVVAMLSRWCQIGDEYQPTNECVRDVPILLRELALWEGQTEMELK